MALVELFGAGAAVTKSVALLSVSAQPLVRMSARVLLGAGAGEVSETDAVLPYPSRSTVVPLASTIATRPAVADMAMAPVASGVGNAAAAVLEPSASLIRKWCPASMLPDSAVLVALVPVADQYCNFQPVRSTVAPERL